MNDNPYTRFHVRRIIAATNDLWKEGNSICKKCHHIKGEMNCLLCFCPKYEDMDCGGKYKILPSGIKDCSGCTLPHDPWFVEEYLMRKL